MRGGAWEYGAARLLSVSSPFFYTSLFMCIILNDWEGGRIILDAEDVWGSLLKRGKQSMGSVT